MAVRVVIQEEFISLFFFILRLFVFAYPYHIVYDTCA